MHRKRRRSLRRRGSRATVVATFAATLGVVVGVPSLASANPVDDLLNGLGLGKGAGGAVSGVKARPAKPKAGVSPTYEPPVHGTNPHAQGSVAVLDTQPSNTNPYPGEPSADGGKEVVIGDSRGEQGSSGYNGKVTLLYLFGNPIVQVTSNPGESNNGPLQDLQDGADQLCGESGGNFCLTVLGMHSSSTNNSSTNSFTAAALRLGGEEGINAEAASSHGNISNDGSCQTAHGDSGLASVGAGGQPVADVMQRSSTSTECNDGSQSVDNNSTVLSVGGKPVPFPSEAFTLFLLITDGTPFVKATPAGPESHALPPPRNHTSTVSARGTAGAGGQGGNAGGGNAGGGNAGGGDPGGGDPGGGDPGGSNAGGSGSAASQAATGIGRLAFTGTDLLALGLVGGALILGGLAQTTAAARRHRQTA
jgi:hypothetical protein